ncbi:hypothetical protein [Robertkochia flava]|uniref:hypothetical protein n=1 Tax=Robertkochia flava TaxID=3447986 RepID=UPI001CCAD1D5|nr:hypothetical protein [Robertkochia marina]
MSCLYSKYLLRASFLLFLVISLNSCSLLRIESAQEPLSRTALNTRIVTQSFAQTASSRVEKMADSILELPHTFETEKAAYLWKIKTLKTYASSAFQTSPEVGLLDTWVITRQLDDFMHSEQARTIFMEHTPLVRETTSLNLGDISQRASQVLPAATFSEYRNLVDTYAQAHPLTDLDFAEQSLRDVYYQYKGIPDSLAIQTVGTLSEVVADLSNRFSYGTSAASKNLRWGTQLFLAERGWDSMNLQQRMQVIDSQLDRLIATVEVAPDKFQVSLRELQGNLRVLFTGLDTTLSESMVYMDRQREAVDSMIMRERMALDTIVARERAAIADELIELTDTFMEEVGDIVKNILIYAIILVVIILVFPFAAGFYLGKVYKRKKALEERNST